MKAAINDASIIIDLIELELIEFLFKLDYLFITSDFIVNEISRIEQKSVLSEYINKQLIIADIPGEAMPDLFKLSTDFRELSIPDCSVLFLAKVHSAIVLTNDKPLRKAAQVLNMEYHGTLWILEQLVDTLLIQNQTAIEKLNVLIQMNPRLPKAECERLFLKWE